MRGRKRVPTALKMVVGNRGKRPINKNEPKPAAAVPKMPGHLDEGAAREWKRMAKQLKVLGLITLIDRSALAAYCQTYSRWCQAEQDLAKSGFLVKTVNGNVVQSPLVGIANRAMELMHKFLSEFGMTPASRARLSVDPPTTAEEKLGKKYFGRG